VLVAEASCAPTLYTGRQQPAWGRPVGFLTTGPEVFTKTPMSHDRGMELAAAGKLVSVTGVTDLCAYNKRSWCAEARSAPQGRAQIILGSTKRSRRPHAGNVAN